MNTFVKTFFICLIITLSFLAYKFVGDESYRADLSVAKNNPVFYGKKTDKLPLSQNPKGEQQSPQPLAQSSENFQKPDIKKEPTAQKYTHICYFYSPSGKLMPLRRQLLFKNSIENTLTLLLKGPTIAESKKGFYSEIPPNVNLISTKRSGNSIIVNLSSNFGNGGGSQSIENRLKQLSATIKNIEPNKNVYLYIENKEVEYLGGDGVYIKQPLE